MQTVTVSLPNNWPVIVAAILTAVVGSALVYIFQVLRQNSKGKKFKDAATHILLVTVTLLFTGLQYAIPFVQEHLTYLQTLPHIGQYAVGIYASMNFLYAIKLKKWFTSAFGWLAKQDATAPTLPEDVVVAPEQQPSPTQNSDF